MNTNLDNDVNQPVVIMSTAPDELIGKRIAHYLVEEGLAACVNLGQESLSMFMWKGSLEGEKEYALTIKTRAGRINHVFQRLSDLHPYEVPEFLVIPVHSGSQQYVDWIIQTTS